MDKCSNYILSKYHDNYKEILKTSENLLQFKKDLNKKVFEHLKIVKMHQELNVDHDKKVSEKTLSLCNLNINLFETQVEKEPDKITYLNSMKFPRPRDVQDPIWFSSGRNLVKVIHGVCSLQDQHPNMNRLELQGCINDRYTAPNLYLRVCMLVFPSRPLAFKGGGQIKNYIIS